MFEICGMHFCSVFCETLWMRLIATFQFSWLPFFDPADATLCLAWVPSYSFGLSATLPWPGCQFIHSAWVPHYLGLGANLFIRPGCHCIYPAWVPHYLGLGAKLFIRPECHISLAWVPIYSFGLSATLPWPGCQFTYRPGCCFIYSADAKTFVWIQPGCCCYWFGLGAISFQSWQVGHFIQVGKFANL